MNTRKTRHLHGQGIIAQLKYARGTTAVKSGGTVEVTQRYDARADNKRNSDNGRRCSAIEALDSHMKNTLFIGGVPA